MKSKRQALSEQATSVREVRRILPEIQSMIEAARHQVATGANLTMVHLYWNIGRVIAQDIQRNEKRAGYGERIVSGLADALIRVYGNGFSHSNLNDMRRFFETFEILQAAPVKSWLEGPPPAAATPTEEAVCRAPSRKSSSTKILQAPPVKSSAPQILPPAPALPASRLSIDFAKHFHLGWTHYRMLLSVEAGLKRHFYFEQAARQRWTTRELQRQIDSALFERVALSRDTRKLVALEKKRPAEIVRYEDVFKDPYLMGFLGLKGVYSEKDLEAAVMRNLEEFLSELGTDFCFIGRQYPMRIDDSDYFLDLLFYHRGLQCLVAVDLKIGAFTSADKGQMDLYLSWLKEHDWRRGENEPVGLILCASKKRQHVELLLRHGPHKMLVSEYRTQMPDNKLLEERLRIYGRLLEEA
ncbi:MAG: PDDEXK nuclease domain-containing protein [Candidatus Sumerlaeota bacterium]|nr:PDDEXK nuclease domain-containing protein [Candidatus Sumerlaeota bacterium]